MSDSKDQLIFALEESVELLTEENSRLRRSNGLLRRINSSLREAKMIQAQNDEAFKAMCQSDFAADMDEQGGLPSSDPSQI